MAASLLLELEAIVAQKSYSIFTAAISSLVWNRNWKRLPSPDDTFDRDGDQVVLKLRWTSVW